VKNGLQNSLYFLYAKMIISIFVDLGMKYERACSCCI